MKTYCKDFNGISKKKMGTQQRENSERNVKTMKYPPLKGR